MYTLCAYKLRIPVTSLIFWYIKMCRIIESVESMVSDLLNKESFNDITISGDTLTMVVEKVCMITIFTVGSSYIQSAISTHTSVLCIYIGDCYRTEIFWEVI